MQNSSGVVKERVQFGSGRKKKTLITQHNPPLPHFFTPLLLSRFSIWHCVLPTEFPEQPMLILPHLLAPFLLYTVCPKEAIPLSGSGKISSRKKKTLITQHNQPLPRFFTPLLLSRCSMWHCVLPTRFPEQPMLILPHSYTHFSLFTVCPKEAIPLSGSGKISSTNYPKGNYTAFRNCTWNITASANEQIQFVFTDFVLSECSANCSDSSCSYVKLYDGGSTSSPSLGRFCQGSSWNEPRFSSGNQMFVMFHPGQTVDRGFEAEYTTTPRTTTSPPTTKTAATSESETTNKSETTNESKTAIEPGERKGKFFMNFLCIEYSKLINAFCYEKVKLLRPTSLMIHYR